MSLPLPSVIGASSSPANPPSLKRFVIVHTVDVPDTDLLSFQNQGKVVQYNVSVEGLGSIDSLLFDYLFIDLRVAPSRSYFDSQNLTNYSVVAYVSFIEIFDAYIESLGANNIISSFPAPTHFKSDWDASLLASATPSPNKCLSLVNYLSSFLASLKASSVKS